MLTTTGSRPVCRLLLALGFLLAAGCDSGDDTKISAQVLTGKLGGKAWTFVQGETNAFLSGGDSYFVTLYASAFTACGLAAAPSDEGSIILSVPKKIGGYAFDLQLNGTFYVPPSDNWVATRGRVEVTEITATTLSGGVNMTYNGDNTVDGQFQATICP